MRRGCHCVTMAMDQQKSHPAEVGMVNSGGCTPLPGTWCRLRPWPNENVFSRAARAVGAKMRAITAKMTMQRFTWAKHRDDQLWLCDEASARPEHDPARPPETAALAGLASSDRQKPQLKA